MLNVLLMLCSNGIGHRADETEFDEASSSPVPPATEPAEPRETTQEQVPLEDINTEQMTLPGPDEGAKPVEDTGMSAEHEPVIEQTQSQDEVMTLEQERPAEVEEVEQEVEEGNYSVCHRL